MNFRSNPYLIILLSSGFCSICYGQSAEDSFVYGDLLPDAPELAARGNYSVGVQTIDLMHDDQIDILNYGEGLDSLYDRSIKVEVWYPAEISDGNEELVTYKDVMGNANSPDRPIMPFAF